MDHYFQIQEPRARARTIRVRSFRPDWSPALLAAIESLDPEDMRGGPRGHVTAGPCRVDVDSINGEIEVT